MGERIIRQRATVQEFNCRMPHTIDIVRVEEWLKILVEAAEREEKPLQMNTLWKVIDQEIDGLVRYLVIWGLNSLLRKGELITKGDKWHDGETITQAPEPAPPLKPTERYAILQRDSYRCRLCGSFPEEDDVKLHVDHIIPRSKGGSNDPKNLWTLCSDCNRGKGTQDL